MWEEEGGTDELSVRAWITCVKSQYVRACVCVWVRVSVCVSVYRRDRQSLVSVATNSGQA